MNKKIILAASLAALVAVGNTAFAAPTTAKPKPVVSKAKSSNSLTKKYWNMPDSTIVGSVNGITVTKGELLKSVWEWNAANNLQEILTNKFIEAEAKKSGISATKKEIDKKVEEGLKQMGIPSLADFATSRKANVDRILQSVKNQVLIEKLAAKNIKVDDASLAEWIKVRHILIKVDPNVKDSDANAKKKIDEIATKIKAGESFEKLADEFSEDPSNTPPDGKKKGGDIGWFTKNMTVPEFEKAAYDLKAGEVSGAVKTTYGYHIIKSEKLGKNATGAEKEELKKLIIEKKSPMETQKIMMEIQAKAKYDNKLAPAPPVQKMPSMPPKVNIKPGKPVVPEINRPKPDTSGVKSKPNMAPVAPPAQ
jgi:foldase protein PrsA